MCDFEECSLQNNFTCDEKCDNLECNWDFQDCVKSLNLTCDNNCNSTWLNDLICDNNCLQSNCSDYEINDCICLEKSSCREYYGVFKIVGTTDELVTKQEFCDKWTIFSQWIPDSDDLNIVNCTSFETQGLADYNNDSWVTFLEGIMYFADVNVIKKFDLQRAIQVNCSQCMLNPEKYDNPFANQTNP